MNGIESSRYERQTKQIFWIAFIFSIFTTHIKAKYNYLNRITKTKKINFVVGKT